MNKEAIKAVIYTYSELLRTHQLNIELLNTLEQALLNVQNFCQKNNISFHDEKLASAIAKIDSLLEEIDSDSTIIYVMKASDDFLQGNNPTGI